MTLLLTSMINVFSSHLELYSRNNRKGYSALPLFTHKREKEQIYSNETKEQACLNKTEGLELVRLLQVHRLTYLTKLTPRGDNFIFYLSRKVMHQGGHLPLDVVQLGVGIDRREALALRRQIYVLVMRTGDRE